MTKSEQRELDKLRGWYEMGGADDIVARGLSVLFRSARTEKSRAEILNWVSLMDLLGHPEFDIFRRA